MSPNYLIASVSLHLVRFEADESFSLYSRLDQSEVQRVHRISQHFQWEHFSVSVTEMNFSPVPVCLQSVKTI